MRYLLIDTAFENGVAGIFEGDRLLREINIPLFANQSRHLFPLLQQMLKESDFPLERLDFIASGVGPGSYTGMRVGAMIAKTFAHAIQKPLVGVCSLQGLSPTLLGPFAALVDARISGAYLLQGMQNSNGPHFNAEPQAVSLESLCASLANVPLLVTTPGNRIRQRIDSKFPNHSWNWQEQHLSIQNLGNAALASFKQGLHSNDASLKLLYLRPTQAELEGVCKLLMS